MLPPYYPYIFQILLVPFHLCQLNLSQMYLICMLIFLQRNVEQARFGLHYIHPISVTRWLLSIIWGEDTEWSIFVISIVQFQCYCISFYPFQSIWRRVRKQANRNVHIFWDSCDNSWLISYKQQTTRVYINIVLQDSINWKKKRSETAIFLIVKFLVLLHRKLLMCLWVQI